MEEDLDQNKVHGLAVKTDTDNFFLPGRPCELSSFSYVPTSRNDPSERTVFNSIKPKDHNRVPADADRFLTLSLSVIMQYSTTMDNPNRTYDRLFRKDHNYNNKLHRDDREHAKSRGLEVNKEEVIKPVPTLASSEYGHRLDQFADHPDRKHVRIAHVRTEFYRRNGIHTT